MQARVAPGDKASVLSFTTRASAMGLRFPISIQISGLAGIQQDLTEGLTPDNKLSSKQ